MRSNDKQYGRLNWLVSWGTPAVALVAYLAFWPTPADPVAWHPPKDAGYTGAHAPNEKLADLQQLSLASGQEGPEFIVANGGVLYTGLSNGDVLKINTDGQQPEIVVNTGGRPLGLDVDGQGRLLVADAMKGLLRVSGRGADAKVETLLDKVQHPVADDRVRYADAVKVGPGGIIWLTDASRRFGAKEWGSTFEASVLDVLEHSCSGRVIAQDPNTLVARVAISGMCFPNGIEFSRDGKTMYVSETGTYRILAVDLAKLSLVRTAAGDNGVPTLDQAMKAGAARVFVDNLPGFPDNLTRSSSNRLWVGLTKPRSPVIDAVAAYPFMRQLTLRLPRFLWPVPKAYGHVIAYDERGTVVDDLQDSSGAYPETTAATEADGKLFIQSLNAHSIGWLPYVGPQVPRAEVESYLEGAPPK
ncbi:MAG: SMP-30/gluconolactonase/LRE family protein [Aquabacterium sp.]|uniref:SMP-30/gluconolactonase/LRE family protein n=1 Tax=Aquabacterium sp. TaxID=1872578 RepID=UPI0012049718|nr:SMP-30/gluconolactonase/LRE family protein [Aquabacterium sp.]TAK86542.1 MAG: SMP-30/gluconolactonase/LRE family protein [Aquabacterium sp.]